MSIDLCAIIHPPEFAVVGPLLPAPPRLMRPCDYGLKLAVSNLEVQLGTIEAYNRIVEAAADMREKIESGKAVAANPIYATEPKGK